MPRMARIDFPDVLQHVMVRGIEGRRIFRSEREYTEFLRRLELVVNEGQADLPAWCLMPNHFHLLLRPRTVSLADIMRRLNTGYAVWFNRRHRRKGHLFQNRYKSLVVEEETYLLELVRYIHLNPLRAGLVESLEALEAWPYSGHAALMGKRSVSWQTTSEVLSHFSPSRPDAVRAYRDFVAAGVDGDREASEGGGDRPGEAIAGLPFPKARRSRHSVADPRVLGGALFVDAILERVEEEKPPPVEGLDDVFTDIGRRYAVTQEEILGPSRDRRVSRARRAFFLAAVERAGVSTAALGRLASRSQPSVWAAVQKARAEREKA